MRIGWLLAAPPPLCVYMQIPDGSLTLANIEARLRQLSRLAQGSAVKLTAKKRDLQEMGVVSREDTPHIRSFSPADEQRVPQWKFAQNKVSVCRNDTVIPLIRCSSTVHVPLCSPGVRSASSGEQLRIRDSWPEWNNNSSVS